MWKIATRKAVWDKFARKWYHNLGKIEILIQVHTKVRVKQESISEGSWYQGPWQGYLPPPGKDMGPKIPDPLWTDPCLWKHYLTPSFLFYPRVFCEEWNLFTNKSRSLCEEHSTYTEYPSITTFVNKITHCAIFHHTDVELMSLFFQYKGWRRLRTTLNLRETPVDIARKNTHQNHHQPRLPG